VDASRSHTHEVSDWKLAFEVEIKMEERITTQTTESKTFFEQSYAYKFVSKQESTVLKQIYLDLKSMWMSCAVFLACLLPFPF